MQLSTLLSNVSCISAASLRNTKPDTRACLGKSVRKANEVCSLSGRNEKAQWHQAGACSVYNSFRQWHCSSFEIIDGICGTDAYSSCTSTTKQYIYIQYIYYTYRRCQLGWRSEARWSCTSPPKLSCSAPKTNIKGIHIKITQPFIIYTQASLHASALCALSLSLCQLVSSC